MNDPTIPLLEAAHDLRTSLDQLRQDLAERAAATDLLDDLAALHELLDARFRDEEAGGYLGGLVQDRARLSGAARRLRGDHERLLERLAALESRATGVSGSEAWSAFGRAFEAFRANLLRHEHREDALLQNAALVDLGNED